MFFSDEPIPRLDQIDGMKWRLTHPPKPFTLPSIQSFSALNSEERRACNWERIDALNQIIVNTPDIARVVANIHHQHILNRRRMTGRGMSVVSGDATLGKTTAVLSAIDSFGVSYTKQYPNWANESRTPIVYVDVPPSSNGRAMMGRFANFFGIPVRPRDTLEDLKRIIVPLMNRSHTQLVVVEEVHNLKKFTQGNGETVNILRQLANQVSATIVLSGVNIHGVANVVGDPQIDGRSGKFVLRPYTVANTAEWKLWNGIVRGFEKELTLFGHKPGMLQEHRHYIYERTQGRLATLGRLITGAAQLVIQKGTRPEDEYITKELLDTVETDLTSASNENALALTKRAA